MAKGKATDTVRKYPSGIDHDATKHVVIPDCQDGPDRPKDHMRWAGNYIAAKRPNVIVQIGDWSDVTSLSSYDKGKKSAENRRLIKDWDSLRKSIDIFERPWKGIAGYKPRLIFTKGNHEQRIDRYAKDNPNMDGTLPDVLKELRDRGWQAYPFLQQVKVDGILYSHLHARTSTGRVTPSSLKYGAPTAMAQAKANMCSVTAGHRPGFDFCELPGAQRTIHSLIVGSFYLHRESYQTVQGNRYYRGLITKHRVRNGEYDLCKVSIDFLKERYSR